MNSSLDCNKTQVVERGKDMDVNLWKLPNQAVLIQRLSKHKVLIRSFTVKLVLNVSCHTNEITKKTKCLYLTQLLRQAGS